MADWIASLSSTDKPRWQALADFVGHWFSPLAPTDGLEPGPLDEAEERLGVHLPDALREFHMLAGTRDDLFRQQNHLLEPSRQYVTDDHLVVWAENQNVVVWGIALDDLGQADPPVAILRETDDAEDWAQASQSFSHFVVQMLLLDLFALSDHGVFAWLSADDTEEPQLDPYVEPLPLPVWHWPAHPTRFYANPDAVLVLDGTGHLVASARTRDAHDRLLAYLNGREFEVEVEWTQ